ncbi:MAG: HipA domain-containing protein [Bacteriovoracaceae bacterium]|nr:HipA domain-containing protein [Bacteriovoracaceae bacterium]
MGRKRAGKTLNVFLNGARVGILKKDSSGQISFKYVDEWIKDGFAISQSLPIQEQEYKGEIVSRYFDNLLPDNDEIKKLVAQKYGAESTRPFDILEVVGKDCVGALSFLPEESGEPPIFEMNYSKLSSKAIAQKIRGLSSTSPLGMEEDDFRLSIAGAQEKTALLKVGKNWCWPHGQTPTTHIIKTPIGALGMDINFDDSLDNEWASLFIMEKFGLKTCKATIERFEDQRVLVVERFDRRWLQDDGKDVILRIPQEDMCQALGVSPYKKYQNEGGPGIVAISKFLASSQESRDRIDFFKAIIIFDLLFATDGHAKNFSIFMNQKGFRLTPFYDVMSGYFLHARKKRALQKLRLAMGIGNSNHYNFDKILKRHYLETASKCLISKDDIERIFVEVKKNFENFNYKASELDKDLKTRTLDLIVEGMNKRAKKLFI